MIMHGVGAGIDLIVALQFFTYDWCHNGLPGKCKEKKAEDKAEDSYVSGDDYYGDYYGYNY